MEDRYGNYKEEESSDSSLENEEYELRECITEKEGIINCIYCFQQ